jgi:hypothetical protein
VPRKTRIRLAGKRSAREAEIETNEVIKQAQEGLRRERREQPTTEPK